MRIGKGNRAMFFLMTAAGTLVLRLLNYADRFPWDRVIFSVTRACP